MLLKKSEYATNVPHHLTSHQLRMLGREILERTQTVVSPLIEEKPHYQAVTIMLGTLERTIMQLEAVHTLQQFKAVKEMRRTGGIDGKTGDERISQKRKIAHNARRTEMRRFRLGLNWYRLDSDKTANSAMAAELLQTILNLRISRFENLSYDESATEFDYFFVNIDNDQAAQNAINLLGLRDIYLRMQQEHDKLSELYTQYNQLKAEREAKPKLKDAMNELKQVLRSLLTHLNFDVINGDDTFKPLLAEIDKAIDHTRAVSDMRETREAKSKLKKEAEAKQAGPSSSNTEKDPHKNPEKDQDLNKNPEKTQEADKNPAGSSATEQDSKNANDKVEADSNASTSKMTDTGLSGKTADKAINQDVSGILPKINIDNLDAASEVIGS